MRIGILTAGGDCPGINAAIRGVGKTAILEYGMEVIGISSGFSGLIDNAYVKLEESQLSGILTTGGTILGTSREKPFKKKGEGSKDDDRPELIRKNYKKMGLDCLVCIGGNGTMKTVYKLEQEGLSVIGIPKTIDNDVWGTDLSFGFDSAVTIATEAIDRLHTTANSHKRTMVIEVMGHNAGWLALESGLAGGADVILIPELKYEESLICDFITERYKKEKPYSIVVVAEGIEFGDSGEHRSAAHYIASLITKRTGIETRETVLGYVQRGGVPSAQDRILGTIFGAHAVKCIFEDNTGVMVALRGSTVSTVPLSEVARKVKLVEPDNMILEKARVLGTCFGAGK
jgi:ATP-dependent phosphofructokinase / diphosphate-dependent phosphofructokinase